VVAASAADAQHSPIRIPPHRCKTSNAHYWFAESAPAAAFRRASSVPASSAGSQTGLPIHPMYPLWFTCSRAAQPHMQPPIPEAWLLPRQLHQPPRQRFIGGRRLVAVTRHRHHHQAARSPLAAGILRSHLPNSCLQRHQLQPFFRITDCACLSRLRSATRFRIFVFPSRNRFASCAGLHPCHRTSPCKRRVCASTPSTWLQRPDHLRFRVSAPAHLRSANTIRIQHLRQFGLGSGYQLCQSEGGGVGIF